MFDIPQPATALHHFAETHNQAIQNAALLLGGRHWLARAQRLLTDLCNPHPLTRRIAREAKALLSLLELDHVDKLNSIEAACFAMLDPEDPYVEEICLLTDLLRDALDDAAQSVALSGMRFEEGQV
ncbi:hypothetical protein [Thalassorhabdomicrobium marinisediminis]|uniref:Uncharacterized protein n=1 Tax=Thalassorhabdomicrobium marinisediminis TaxID=2170577 RepID=A0A2T7FZC1_9RHOB|nr:hypothetical protein [Thalassorhabdomicrobium marinisediminis]PVA07505.1 hypothetical protein DC363_02410 [Thalassorhabdomicrobium marinisediminis]